MKFTGRILSQFVVIASSTGWGLFSFVQSGYTPWSLSRITVSIVGTIIYLFFGWWLGSNYDKAKFFSEKDELTNVYNRRYIQRNSQRYIDLARKKDKPFSLLLIDVNNFKDINDTYGHDTGDVILQEVATILKDSIGPSSITARWGGDEFIVIYQNFTVTDKALRIIHRDIKGLSEKTDMPITLSIGTALYGADGYTFQQLYKKADIEMYNNKIKVEAGDLGFVGS